MNRVSIDHKGQSRRFSLPGHKNEKEAGTWIFGQNHFFFGISILQCLQVGARGLADDH